MDWDVAQKIIDNLFKMYDDNVEGAFITGKTKQIILDFIGGEPLMYIDLMYDICEYFYETAIKKRHIWAETFMISMASNGTLYRNDRVQEFLYKFKNHMSFSVSIDGPKEMHDACRVFYDGKGSFDLAKDAQDDYNNRFSHSIGTKATIARANLPYLDKLIKYYVEQGFEHIYANCVYEEEWNYDDAKLFYEKLKWTADYILSLDHKVEISLFDDIYFQPMLEEDNNNWCGGTGKMLAYDPYGDAFPCIRYMHSSLNDEQVPLKIGDIENGLYNTKETIEIRDMLESITRRSQSTDECFYCPIASGCSWCSGWNYQLYGTPNKRCTRICAMHKARSLGNVYYYNKLYLLKNEKHYFHRYLPDSDCLNIIDNEELNMLNQLEEQAKNNSADSQPINSKKL